MDNFLSWSTLKNFDSAAIILGRSEDVRWKVFKKYNLISHLEFYRPAERPYKLENLFWNNKSPFP